MATALTRDNSDNSDNRDDSDNRDNRDNSDNGDNSDKSDNSNKGVSLHAQFFHNYITYFAINISDKKSRRFDLSEVIFKCIIKIPTCLHVLVHATIP